MGSETVIAAYEDYQEEDRLTTDNARGLEYRTTLDAMALHIPDESRILDVAAGTGIYALHLADLGHSVTALDLTPRHIEIIREELQKRPRPVQTAVNDARDLSGYPACSFDVVLCMGPLYHLIEEADRRRCVSECLRVLRPGGLLFGAYISRHYAIHHIIRKDSTYLDAGLAQTLLQSGVLRSSDNVWTDAYFATPQLMEELFAAFSLEVVDHLTPDGIGTLMPERINSLSEQQLQLWFQYHLQSCREPSLLGMGNHGLIIGRKT